MRAPCAAAALILSSLPTVAPAQAPPAAANAPPPRWERKAELSLVETGGNTDTQTLGLGASVVFRPEGWTTDARVAFVRSEAAGLETAKSLVADLRQARALTPRVELFGRYGYLGDRFAGIEHRHTGDGGVGYKLLIVEPYRVEPDKRASLITTGRTFVAVDTLGAGEGDYVLITQGSSARMTPETKNMPVDTVVVGIIDQVHVEQACVYSREGRA